MISGVLMGVKTPLLLIPETTVTGRLGMHT